MNRTDISMKGQTLIEVLVALGIAGLIVSAIAVVLTTSLNNAQFSKNQNLATEYAQQGMELVRQIRDNDIISFRSYDGKYCLAKGQTTFSSAQANCPQNVDAFTRDVIFDQNPGCSANVAKVTVNVSWKDGKCASNTNCHSIPLISCLSTVSTITGP